MNKLIPCPSENKDDEGHQLVLTVDQLDMNADESTLIIAKPPTTVEFFDDKNETQIVEKIKQEEVIDDKQIRADLKQRSYETILYHTVPLNDEKNAIVK